MTTMFERLDEEEKDEKPKGEGKGGEGVAMKLLEKRLVLVNGPVNDKMYQSVTAQLFYLQIKDPKAEITVVVNSPGGSADSGFGIYDTMKLLDCPIRTLVSGLSASAAVLISLGGSKGRRFMTPSSRFLLHQPSTQAYGQASDMQITAQEILRTRKKYAGVIAGEIGLSVDKVESDCNRDFWLGSDESLKYGLVDKIRAFSGKM